MTVGHLDRRDTFTGDECAAIVALAVEKGLEAATAWTGAADAVNDAVRSAVRAYLGRSDSTAWIFDRLDALFAEAAIELGFEVGPMTEDLQVVRYDVGGHYATWHSDAGTDLGGRRVLSASVELSAPGEHDGGDLEIVPGTVGLRRSLPKGGARVFASQALHRVTPVTRGLRWALVVWTGCA